MKINSLFFVLLGLCFLFDCVNSQGCEHLRSLKSFKSVLQFSTNERSYYIEETKQNDVGKLLIRHGNYVQKIYYREKSKFILFETDKNKCFEYTYENRLFVPKFDQLLYAYEVDDKPYLGPSAIFQQFTKEKTIWEQLNNKTERQIECMTCINRLAPETKFADLTNVEIHISVREKDEKLEPVRMQIIGLKAGGVRTAYIYDYFMFENLNDNVAFALSRIDRNYNDFVLDLPLTGCSKAKMLGNLEFALYIPEVLKLHLNIPKSGQTKPERKTEIVYDHKNQLIRVDNLDENYYEIADLNQKNLFHFQNNEDCTPFYYRANLSKNILEAKSFIDEIYALKDQKFYHVGQEILEGNIIAQVFEWSVIINEQENKTVTTLFTREMNFTTNSKEKKDENKKKIQLGLLKMVNSLYSETDAEKGYELKNEFIYNIEDYGQVIYDENYRSLFDLRSCIEHFRDRAYIALEARFDKNSDKQPLPANRLIEEHENVKRQISRSILDSFTVSNSIQSIQFVGYDLSDRRLQLQIELINTNWYTDSFIEYEDGEYTKNASEKSTLDTCAFESYNSENTFVGFRYCSLVNKMQKGTCYLVDDSTLFQKPKKNIPKFTKSNDPDSPPIDQDPSDDKPDEEKKTICILMKRSMKNISLPIAKNLWNLKQLVKDGKLKVELKNNKQINMNEDHKETKKDLNLNFNLITIQPNSELYRVEEESNSFEIVATKSELKAEYVNNELDSSHSTIRSLIDCFTYCWNAFSEDVACHSFVYCYDSKTTISRCQLSGLYFDRLIGDVKDENLNQIRVITNSSTGDETDGHKLSKYFKESPECKVYNFEYQNFFEPKGDVLIGDSDEFTTLIDHTLDECIGECYLQSKQNETVNESTTCRSVEYCLIDEKVNENELGRKSFCRLTSREGKDLVSKRLKGKQSNCELYDWRYLTDYHLTQRYEMKKVRQVSRQITREECAKKCSIEPYCNYFELCWFPIYGNVESNPVGVCTYESTEEEYEKIKVKNNEIGARCLTYKKNDGLLMHQSLILESNSPVIKYRAKIISTRDEDEVLSDTFWKLNISLFICSIFIVFILILAYKKFYNRYRTDPQQTYQSFINNTFSNTFNKKRYGC